jgi:hypothetical protein
MLFIALTLFHYTSTCHYVKNVTGRYFSTTRQVFLSFFVLKLDTQESTLYNGLAFKERRWVNERLAKGKTHRKGHDDGGNGKAA